MSLERLGEVFEERESHVGKTVEEYLASRDFSGKELIVTPGTSDMDGSTLSKWARVLIDRFESDATTWVDYPASVGPIVSGQGAASTLKDRWHAHRYDESKIIAYTRTLAAIERADSPAVLFGYSQGADSTWEAAVSAVEQGLIAPDQLEVVLWAHPGMPGGIKDVVSRDHKIAARVLKGVFKADMGSHWQAHPDIDTTVFSMRGDAITDFPAAYPNPLRFAREFRDGFFGVHSGVGELCADKFPELRIGEESYQGPTRQFVLETSAR